MAGKGKGSGEANMVGALLAMLGDAAIKDFESAAWRTRDTDVKYDGTMIVLPSSPKPMTLEAAIETLERKLEEENTFLDVNEMIEGYPFDAAVALLKAMRQTYGWAQSVPTPGFFGPINPDLLTVKIGPKPKDTLQVPMGSFKIPNVENNILVSIRSGKNELPTLMVSGEVRKREHSVLRDLVALAKEILKSDSIYRGKSLRIPVDDRGELQRELQPDFLETDHVRPEELILSKDVQDQLDTNLFTLVRHTEACKMHKIPLKRSILLDGIYGVGKTLTASIASLICIQNGWTFILLDNVRGLKAALEFAQAYQPALVFAEDIDRVTEERDESTNDLLNTISGVVTKDAEVITVLSTNHVEKIHQAMLRPGRLDAVINILPPDAEAVGRLIHLYGRGLVKADEDLSIVGEKLAGQIPATVREVVERAKLGMVKRGSSIVIASDLEVAADGMKRHLELLNRPATRTLSPAERLGEAMSDIVRSGSNGASDSDVEETVGEIRSTVGGIDKRVQLISKNMAEAAQKNAGPLKTLADQVSAMSKRVEKIQAAVV